MSNCVIPKDQSIRCLTAARNIRFGIPQIVKLSRADEAITTAILEAIATKQIDNWEVVLTSVPYTPLGPFNRIRSNVVDYQDAIRYLSNSGWKVTMRSPVKEGVDMIIVWVKDGKRIITICPPNPDQWELFESTSKSVMGL